MPRFLLHPAAAFFALACHAFAESNVTLYEANFGALDPGLPLTGQDGWETNDVDTGEGFGESDGIVTLSEKGQLSAAGALGGLWGGDFPPGEEIVYLWRPFQNNGLSLHFETDCVFVPSLFVKLSNRDTFGWALLDSAGNQIFRLAFEPASGFPDRSDMVWYDAADTGQSTGFHVFTDARPFSFFIDVEPEAGGDRLVARIDDGSSVTVLADTLLPAGTIPMITRIAANWRITDPSRDPKTDILNAFGGNFLAFDKYLVTTTLPNSFEAWMKENGFTDPDDDPDRDGLTHFHTYAVGADLASAAARTPELAGFDAGQRVTMRYRRRTCVTDVLYVVEASSDTVNWQSGPAVIEAVGDPVDNGDGTETVTVRAVAANTESTRYFLRLTMTLIE